MCSALECSLVDAGAGGKAAGELASWAKKLRDQQIESLAAVDDEMMEAFVEFNGEVPGVVIDSALQRAAAAGRIMPLVAGSAKTGLGIDALQEVVHRFIPAGDNMELLNRLGVEPIGGVSFSADAPFLGWVFGQRREGAEVMLEVRVLDGTLKPEQPIKALSSSCHGEVFVPKRLLAHGLRGELVACRAAGPGDIVLVPAPGPLGKFNHAGFVLSDGKRPFMPGRPAEQPEPRLELEHYVLALQVDDLERKEYDRLMAALTVLQEEHDGLHLKVNSKTGEHLLSCMGPLHLELIRERLAEEFKILKLKLGKPKVPYHATLKGSATVTGTHERGGKVRIRKGIVHKAGVKPDALAKVELAPGSRGSGIEIEDQSAAAQSIFKAIKRGIYEGLQHAGPGGVPITDVRVRLLKAEAESEEAAEVAGESAIVLAVDELEVTILEPVVELEVDVPAQTLEDVVEDLKRRRAEVWGSHLSESGSQVVDAEVPLREILDYGGAVQRLTHGEGFFCYNLQSYREVEEQLAKQILDLELRDHPQMIAA